MFLLEKGFQMSAWRRLDFSLLILVLKSGEEKKKKNLLLFGEARSCIWLKCCIFSFKLR